jgi:hypothetical protein
MNAPYSQRDRSMKLTTQLYLVPRFRMSGAVTPLTHMALWRAQKHLFTYRTKILEFFIL